MIVPWSFYFWIIHWRRRGAWSFIYWSFWHYCFMSCIFVLIFFYINFNALINLLRVLANKISKIKKLTLVMIGVHWWFCSIDILFVMSEKEKGKYVTSFNYLFKTIALKISSHQTNTIILKEVFYLPNVPHHTHTRINLKQIIYKKLIAILTQYVWALNTFQVPEDGMHVCPIPI